MEAGLKYTVLNEEPGSAHMLTLDLVPRGARVLEFGCATGYMSEALRERLGCSVTGIEISPEAGELARERCDRLIIGDAEQLDYEELFGKERFDAILFVDVLEHLREPAALLRRIRPFLSRNGVVIASIPNIAHGSVRLALLAGEFRYRDVGLLDDTHLRFFTREGIRDLFEGTGYVVTDWLHHRVDVDSTEVAIPPMPMSDSLREWLSEDPDVSVYQFVVRARVSTAANQVATLRKELAAARQRLGELDDLRSAITELRSNAEAAEELRDTIEQQSRVLEALRDHIQNLGHKEQEQRDLLLEANRQVLERDQEIRRLELEQRRKNRLHQSEIREHQSEMERLQEKLMRMQQAWDAMHATRAWRAVTRFWRTREALFRTVRRS